LVVGGGRGCSGSRRVARLHTVPSAVPVGPGGRDGPGAR
jgi:hypothetical protein